MNTCKYPTYITYSLAIFDQVAAFEVDLIYFLVAVFNDQK